MPLFYKSLPSLSVSRLQVLEGHYMVPLAPSIISVEEPLLSQPVLVGKVIQPSEHPHGPPLDPLQQLHAFPVLGPSVQDVVLQVGVS